MTAARTRFHHFLISRLIVLTVPSLLAIAVMAPSPVATGEPVDVVVQHSTVNPVADLIAEHDCWTGAAPADMKGQLPGHVVVTLPGASDPSYRGARTGRPGTRPDLRPRAARADRARVLQVVPPNPTRGTTP